MYWESITTNNATDVLYLSGHTYSMASFAGLPAFGDKTFSAKYSLQTMSYIWVKAYKPYVCCYNSIALNKAEDTLAVVIYSLAKYYIFLIDPETGIEKYNYLEVSPFFSYNMKS